MKFFYILYIFLLTCLTFPFAVRADDTVGSIKAGSLVLEKTDGISLTQETLSVSENQIQVHLEFVNKTKKDITTLVAFPIPDIEIYEGSDNSINIDSSNPMKFKVKVDGKEKPVKLERKLLSGKNIDPQIYSLKYYWEETFLKKKTMVIEHTYVPAIGSTGTHGEATSEEIKTYCMNPDTIHSALKLLQAKTKNDGTTECPNLWYWNSLDYTLKTGANWKGPIGSFEMIINKKTPQDLISLCFDGALEKIHPTQFKYVKKDFEPREDLHILFIDPRCYQ